MFKNFVYMTMSFLLVIAVFACTSEEPGNTPATNLDMEFLPVEQAFQFSSTLMDNNTIKASWKIADGYHLYKNKFGFEMVSANYQIDSIDYPASEMLNDKIFGMQESYKQQVDIIIKVSKTENGGPIKLQSKYQGCAAQGLCYPPQKTVVEMSSVEV